MPRLVPSSDTGNGVKRASASWASGKEVVGDDRLFRGWFIDAGIDQDLDDAALAAGWQVAKLVHIDGESREHWLIPSPCVIFPLIEGLPYTRISALASHEVSTAGIACSWVKGQRSRLAIMALVQPLVEQGYLSPLPFIVSSTSTDDFLLALVKHNEVLDKLEAASQEAGKPMEFEFHAIGLPLIAGPKVTRGKPGMSNQMSPIMCGHPEMTRATMKDTVMNLKAPPSVAEVYEREWDTIVQWAFDFKTNAEKQAEQYGQSGDRNQQSPNGRSYDRSVAPNSYAPSGPGARRGTDSDGWPL